MSKKKPTDAEAWAKEHQFDSPMPRDPDAARAWRNTRGQERNRTRRWLRSRIDAANDPWIQRALAKLG